MVVNKIPCEHIFSNGTEFGWFMETQCWRGCTRYRNDHCRVLNAIYKAMWDETAFPYNNLLDFEGYAGKCCKHYTTEKTVRHKNHKLQEERGQISLLEQ